MGLPRLSWLYLAFLSFSALAADPPIPRANVTLNPTTSYYEVNRSTVRTPAGVSVSPVRDITPHVSSYTGGLQQTTPAAVTINATKTTGPMGVAVRATNQTLKNGAKTLLKGSLATLALGAGIQQLLNGVDWVMGEGGQIQQQTPIPSPSGSGGYLVHDSISENVSCPIIINPFVCPIGCSMRDTRAVADYRTYTVTHCMGRTLVATNVSGFGNYRPFSEYETSDVSGGAIDDAVDNSYNPDPSDWQNLAPHFTPDDVEITSAPTLQSEPKTTTIYDANGNPVEVKETNIWWDFDIRDNPSPEPKLDLKEKEETKTYEDGQLTGTTTTQTTVSSGSGSRPPPPPELEIPTDCDFMPTVCAFLDWFKEPNPELEQEQDLAQLINDVDYERNYSISFGENSCPAPIEINVIFLNKTVQLSYEPACQLAVYAKPFVLISAYIFAIFITLGVVRNG